MEQQTYNIYCDESCHLEKDHSDIMVLGAITCPKNIIKEINKDIRNIKEKYNLSSWMEIKWTKVSKTKVDFYIELIDYFFENPNLYFRGIVATGKSKLNHNIYNNGSYDLWYYKMYYTLLVFLIYPSNNYKYRIFIDIKDTRGGPKIKKLYEVLRNKLRDSKKNVITDIKQINSKESEILQLTDLFNGMLSFYHRGLLNDGLDRNLGKKSMLNHLLTKYNINLENSAPKQEKKFNIFIWNPRGV